MSSEIVDFVAGLTLVDHHVHGAYRSDGPEDRFQNALNEANNAPLIDPGQVYDSQLGFAVRRWCAPLLDLPPHVGPHEYWRRRAALGELEVGRRLTRAAGVGDWVIDTGFTSGEFLDITEMAAVSGGRTHEVVRLEAVAEELVATLDDGAEYGDAFRDALQVRARDAIGTKSVMAYRCGFDHDLARPPRDAVAAAAARWRDVVGASGTARLTDPVLIGFGIHAAVDLGLPLQLHVGLGDRDLDLRGANPLDLLDFLRDHDRSGVPVLLLHCYPYEREAGYLAQAFETVYLDVGLATNFLGVRSRELIAGALELAPFGKLLYSSDGFGPAEHHYLGAALWRRAISDVFTDWVSSGDWSGSDACRVAAMIGRDNARRVYGLG